MEALFFGIIFGKLRGGNFKRLAHLSFKVPLTAYIAFIFMLITSIMITLGNQFFIDYRMYFYIGAYCCLFVALFFNLHYKSIWLILIGALLNFTAITLNSGSMPIDLAVLEKLGLNNLLTSISSGALPNYIPIEEATSFTVRLGKYIALPEFYPFSPILSIGDILISLGLFLLVQSIMISSMHRRATKTLKFDYKKSV